MNRFRNFLFLTVALFGSVAQAAEPIDAATVGRIYSLIDAYTKQLFPHHDPFANVYDIDSGRAIFEQLKIRQNSDGTFSNSPLTRLNKAIINFHAQNTKIDTALITDTLQDAESVLQSKKYKRKDRQSNLLSLYYLLDYLRRFNVDVSNIKAEKSNETDKKEKEKQQKKEKQNPLYPELPKNYKPHTKDTEKDKEKGSKEDQVVVVEANFPTPYFGQRYFVEIIRGAGNSFQEINLPTSFSSPSMGPDTGKEMIIRPLGSNEVVLFLPPGHAPYQPTDPRASIYRNQSGGYVLKTNELLDEVTIPLHAGFSEQLPAHIIDMYTRPVGIEFNEWPALIRTQVFHKFDPSHDHTQQALSVALTIAHTIAGNNLYSVGPRPQTDPIDALNEGAFQCDMAAYIMVSVLRDAYHIPSRVVGGYRAKKHQSGSNQKSYLVLPGDGHAWIEVFHQGVWYPFDPTPIKKDKKDKENEDGEKDEYSDREDENRLKPEPEDKSEDKKDPTKNAGKERGKENDKDKELQAGHGADQDKLDESDMPIKLNVTGAMDIHELANKLELGSLEMMPAPEANPLKNRGYRHALYMVLDPNLDGTTTLEHLNRMGSLFRGLPDPRARSIYLDALQVHAKKHLKLEGWLSEISNLLSTRDIATTYREVYFAKKSIELFAPLIDTAATPYPTELLYTLTKILSDLHDLAHPDSQNIALVNSFMKSLPGIIEDIIREDYGLISVGPNAPTRKIAQFLRDGKFNDYRLLSILNPYTDFVINAHPRPEYEEIRTWMREPRQPAGAELLPLERFSEMARAIFLKPGLSAEENIKQGMAYLPTTRLRSLVPSGFGKDDAERITIVLYDTSGSMIGEPEQFQAGLIAAFMARAISDVSPSGNHRHKVVLVPFDSEPGTPVKITNTDEAFNVLRHYLRKLANTGGGTDIQKAMLQALALIADAEQRAGEPLAMANIILMTDGQASIDLDELARARNAIDRETPIQTMFIAINSSNNDLIEFARSSERVGFESGFYREFTAGRISELLKKATEPIPEHNETTIYSEKSAFDIPFSTQRLIDQCITLARTLANNIQLIVHNKVAADYLHEMEGVRAMSVEHFERPLEVWIHDMRRFAHNAVFKDKILLNRMVDDLMKNFKQLTGIDVTSLSSYELEELRHLLRFAAGIVDV